MLLERCYGAFIAQRAYFPEELERTVKDAGLVRAHVEVAIAVDARHFVCLLRCRTVVFYERLFQRRADKAAKLRHAERCKPHALLHFLKRGYYSIGTVQKCTVHVEKEQLSIFQLVVIHSILRFSISFARNWYNYYIIDFPTVQQNN